MMVVRFSGTHFFHPRGQRRQNFLAIAFRQNATSLRAIEIFRGFELFQNLSNGSFREIETWNERTILRRDAPDTAMCEVAARIAKMILHVADERIVPIGDVERAVWTHPHIDGTKRVVGGNNQWSKLFQSVTRAVVGKTPTRHAILFERSGNQISLPIVREMSSADDFAASKFSLSTGNWNGGGSFVRIGQNKIAALLT